MPGSVKVTVLMPVYNAAPYLREAVDSILGQTFRDFEFLIIDDGSSDDSIRIIEGYNDSRIRFIRNEKNLGISATLNRGIELSSCELIARMDADDISYPTRLQKQYDYMQANPQCGLLSTWAKVVAPDRQFVSLEKYPHQYYYYNLNFECWMYHPTVMFRRSVVKEVGMYSQPYSEDYDLFWKIARLHRIDNLDEPLVEYRLSPNSLNTVLKKAEYDEANRLNVLRNLRYYMGEEFEIDDVCLECLRHNFGPILALNSIEPILECLDTLAAITAAIQNKPNVNLKASAVREAAWHKKDFIVEQMFLQLTGFQKFTLVMRAGKPEILYRKIQKSLRWRLNSVKQHFQSPKKH